MNFCISVDKKAIWKYNLFVIRFNKFVTNKNKTVTARGLYDK